MLEDVHGDEEPSGLQGFANILMELRSKLNRLINYAPECFCKSVDISTSLFVWCFHFSVRVSDPSMILGCLWYSEWSVCMLSNFQLCKFIVDSLFIASYEYCQRTNEDLEFN